MSWILAAALRVTVVKLRCPWCGHVQVRSKMPTGHRFLCRRCRRPYTEEDTARGLEPVALQDTDATDPHDPRDEP